MKRGCSLLIYNLRFYERNKARIMNVFLVMFIILFLLININFISAQKYTLKVTEEHPFFVMVSSSADENSKFVNVMQDGNDGWSKSEVEDNKIDGNWVAAKNLKIGDSLITADGKKAKITSIKEVNENVEVYNLEAEPFNDFIVAGNVVVHNSNDKTPYDTISRKPVEEVMALSDVSDPVTGKSPRRLEAERVFGSEYLDSPSKISGKINWDIMREAHEMPGDTVQQMQNKFNYLADNLSPKGSENFAILEAKEAMLRGISGKISDIYYWSKAWLNRPGSLSEAEANDVRAARPVLDSLSEQIPGIRVIRTGTIRTVYYIDISKVPADQLNRIPLIIRQIASRINEPFVIKFFEYDIPLTEVYAEVDYRYIVNLAYGECVGPSLFSRVYYFNRRVWVLSGVRRVTHGDFTIEGFIPEKTVSAIRAQYQDYIREFGNTPEVQRIVEKLDTRIREIIVPLINAALKKRGINFLDCTPRNINIGFKDLRGNILDFKTDVLSGRVPLEEVIVYFKFVEFGGAHRGCEGICYPEGFEINPLEEDW